MKEIKAFVHRGRVSDIVRALEEKGYRRLTVIDVRGLLQALSDREYTYSVEIGERVISEVRLELVCEDHEVATAVRILREQGFTGQPVSGWVYVSSIDEAWPIERPVK
jgi:nitrogen regulatory protein P-II 1